MININRLTTTTDNYYEDIMFDGTIDDLNDCINGFHSLEFIYKKDNGEKATLILAGNTVEAIFLQSRETHMERVEDEESGAVSYVPKNRKKSNGIRVKFNTVKTAPNEALIDYYSKMIKDKIMSVYEEELNKHSDTASERTLKYALNACFKTFPPTNDGNITRMSYFLTICLPWFIEEEIKSDPEIFTDENAEELESLIHTYVESNEDFQIYDDEEDDEEIPEEEAE